MAIAYTGCSVDCRTLCACAFRSKVLTKYITLLPAVLRHNTSASSIIIVRRCVGELIRYNGQLLGVYARRRKRERALDTRVICYTFVYTTYICEVRNAAQPITRALQFIGRYHTRDDTSPNEDVCFDQAIRATDHAIGHRVEIDQQRRMRTLYTYYITQHLEIFVYIRI